MSFPAIAVQFIFTDKMHISPVTMAVSYSIASMPWCVKPIYGYISDKYALFNWGKRRPYIAYSGLFASYIYLSLGKVTNDFSLEVGTWVKDEERIVFIDEEMEEEHNLNRDE